MGELLEAVSHRFPSSGGDLTMHLITPTVSAEEWERVREAGCRAAIRILGNAVDADRAVGRATEKVAKSETEPEKLGPYFVTVVEGEAKRIYRRRHGKATINGGEWDWSDEGESIASFDKADAVGYAMQDLSETDRTILKMHYWELMTFEEIGVVLGKSSANVRMRHRRAIRKLRDRLDSTLLAG